jgi:hypothetical protein
MPGGENLVAFTRILHRTRPDLLMDEARRAPTHALTSCNPHVVCVTDAGASQHGEAAFLVLVTSPVCQRVDGHVANVQSILSSSDLSDMPLEIALAVRLTRARARRCRHSARTR